MNSSHIHSFTIVGGNSHVLPHIYKFLESEDISMKGNPDLFVREYNTFGIGDAIELRRRALTRAIETDHRVFIIIANDMTREAQNALLKILEEPSAGARFFFVVPMPETLLPTLRSRGNILNFEETKSTVMQAVDTVAFLKAQPEKRIEMLKPLLEKDKDDRRDLGAIITFLASLERMISNGLEKKEVREGVHAIYRARTYITDRGALVKPLLETVALLVPRM